MRTQAVVSKHKIDHLHISLGQERLYGQQAVFEFGSIHITHKRPTHLLIVDLSVQHLQIELRIAPLEVCLFAAQ